MKNLSQKGNFIKIGSAACALFFSVGCTTVYAQLSTIPAGQHLYVSIDDHGAAAKQYFQSKSDQIGSVTVIYGRDIYPGDPQKVNEDVLKAAIVKAFPDGNAAGIAAMDWEGPAFDILAHGDPSDSNYQDVLSEFQKALQIAKATRPNVKWGFYDVPFRRIVFKTDKEWIAANNKIAPLLKSIDCLFPAFYATYSFEDNPVQKGTLAAGQSIYDKDAKESLWLARKYSKPDLPFIWHRYEVHDTDYRDKVIPADKFVDIAKSILNASYKGRKVNGIVWWSKDTEFYLHDNKQVRSEAPDLEHFKNQYDSLIVKYSDRLLKQVH
ncbi:MAG: hypothetical protein ACXVA2_20050 [Mucilaginibacter sp.]